ncbi:MAG: hypothetical protein EOP34_07550, partial [Rickettsiales bacterium]
MREALTKAAANGNTEKDFIYFNLLDLSEAGRTITLVTDLPSLSSNLIIDGSTQPGNKIGISNAKIILKTFRSKISLNLFSGKNIEQVEFYSLYFLDTTNPCISDPDGATRITIKIDNSKNIVIGDQNRGNVFNGYKYSVLDISNTDGLVLADNFFGQSSYAFQSICSGGITLLNVTNIVIGGINKTNTIISGLTINYTDIQTIKKINITNNFIGIYSDGITTDHSFDGSYITIQGQVKNLTDRKPIVDMLFKDNLMTHYSGAGGIVLSLLDGTINSKHNWFGIDKSGTVALNLKRAHAGDGTAINLFAVDAEVVIGDEDPDEGNKIAYTYIGILNYNSAKVKILRNSFKCIGRQEYLLNGSMVLPSIKITQNTSSYIKGTTTAGAIVDIFASDDCINCSPETFIGTTITSTFGEWQYPLTKTYNRSLIAIAHIGKQSSNFTKPVINAVKVEVTDYDCNQKGKISGIEINNTDKIKWVDEKGEIVSTEIDLKNVLPGKYKLIIGEYCTTESEFFTVQDLTPQIYSSFAIITQPECGKSNGSVVNLYTYSANNSPLTYSWLNQDLKQVGQSKDIRNLPAGSYILKVSSQNCTTNYGPVILK